MPATPEARAVYEAGQALMACNADVKKARDARVSCLRDNRDPNKKENGALGDFEWEQLKTHRQSLRAAYIDAHASYAVSVFRDDD